MTSEKLRKAEATYRASARRSDEARERRDATIRAALREGWTHARIANATGLTRGRVGQIASSGLH